MSTKQDETGSPPVPPTDSTAAFSVATALRTHNCGELRMSHVGQTVKLSGWVQTARDMNHFAFVDLRDRYGITQCIFNNRDGDEALTAIYMQAKALGREFVIQVTGEVVERSSKNANRATGEIEIVASALKVLNKSLTPPFMIEDVTDGKEDLRLKYRYLDLRRNPMREALVLRSKVTQMIRASLNGQEFIEVETPVLIKSTPEGARDFVVPSRMNPGQFYALPQSPQTFKQILMVAGLDRYFQIVKCFRDEDLRNDRQPEFTQIDCEMSFVAQEDVLSTFEAMIAHVFKKVVGHDFPTPFPRMTYAEAMRDYGIDKPDLRFDMKLCDITEVAQNKGFKLFDEAELVVAICVDGSAVDQQLLGAQQEKDRKSGKSGKKAKKGKKPKKEKKVDLSKFCVKKWTKKVIKTLVKQCKSSQVGSALFWVKCECLAENKLKIDSSVKKNFTAEQMAEWARACGAKDGDLLCIMAGADHKTRESMGRLRHLMGTRLGLRSKGFNALWVVDFPLLEWNEDENRYTAMHHPFTSPKDEDMHLMEKGPDGYDPKKIGQVRANAYDMVINGCEVGGGSIRVHERGLQSKVFDLLGFTPEEANEQFGFLLGAFEYGAPPHGGLAFGLDRICMILGGADSIRDYIAFPKNYMGRDLMIDAPSAISQAQLTELCVAVNIPVEEAEASTKEVEEGVKKMAVS